MQEIATAAETWNSFFGASKQITVLNGSSSSGSSMNQTSALDPLQSGTGLCSSSLIAINRTQFGNGVSVGIYKVGANWKSSTNTMALTSFCKYTGFKPYPLINQAVIQLNYQNFFISGKPVPDLQTILLHELGHLLGLDHSCEPNGSGGKPNCNDSNLDPSYLEAVMFWTFRFDISGAGEQKRVLKLNDQNRANCLY